MEPRFYQIIEGKIYPKKSIQFRDKANHIKSKKIQIRIINNKLYVFVPIQPVKDKDHENIGYIDTMDKQHHIVALSTNNLPFHGKITYDGKPSKEWVRFNNLKQYFNAFEKYKKTNIHNFDNLMIAFEKPEVKTSPPVKRKNQEK
jgi:hypothetical protein